MPRKKQEPEEKLPALKRAPDIVLTAVLTGIGTAVAFGVISAPAEFWRWATRPADFPSQAVVFTTAPDCGSGRWEKMSGVEGRFIVIAGANQRPGEVTPGRTRVKLKSENLPSVSVRVWHRSGKADLSAGDVGFVSELSTQVAEGFKQEILRFGASNNEEVDITPPGFALTICKRKD